MSNILEKIAERTKERIREEKKSRPLFDIRAEAECLAASGGRESWDALPFEKALREGSAGKNPAFICEVKRASPSKGIITEDYCYMDIARAYERAGAAAVSCLTEPFWFRGEDRHLRDLAEIVSLPILRKDFTVEPYMLYQARVLGASAVLLICSVLEAAELQDYLSLSASLGLSALTEVHDEYELETALACGARVIGVNNRNLKDFSVDTKTSTRLARLIPQDILFVVESGIRTREDVRLFREHRADALLIGETLMRAADKQRALESLRCT